MKICDNCARAIKTDRNVLPVDCTLKKGNTDYNYTCEAWVGAEDDGYITQEGEDGK